MEAEAVVDVESVTGLESLRVLVVDDEPDVRLGVSRLVAGLGPQVTAAESGEAALRRLERGRYDLVITDVRMPGMSGMKLLEEVRRRWQETAVMLLTGFGTIELAVNAIKAGAEHFITKPFDNQDLLRTVRAVGGRVLARRRRAAGASGAGLIARDPRMLQVLDLVEQVSGTRLPVLISGETGTGKELIAREVHRKSPRRDRGFHAVNCAALPDTLLESELFGHRKGAFTGADRDREGLFVQARGGTVFLDEAASMTPSFQAKLLRVLQDKVVRPLGSAADVEVDFRLIAATNRDLDEMVESGAFRRDLLHRLRVLSIEVPPLRQRPADIPMLAEHFVRELAQECRPTDAPAPRLSGGALEALRGHDWPGNVRELENTIMRALVVCRGEELLPAHLDIPSGEDGAGEDGSYEEAKQAAIRRFQRRYIEAALEREGGNVSRAAQACGMTRAALQKIMRSLDIDRRRFTD